MTELEKIKKKLADNKGLLQEANGKLDLVKESVVGIRKDVNFLKKKIEDLIRGGNGATEDQLKELNAQADETFASVNDLGAKVGVVAEDAAQLDSETDSTVVDGTANV